MTRTRTIKVAALNIAMHRPHSPERYVQALKDAEAMKLAIKLGELHGAFLGTLNVMNWEERGVTGEIYRFVQLDPKEPWFNSLTKEAATPEEREKVMIPEHMLPHLRRIHFHFRPKRHELWYVCQDRKARLGPKTAELFFQRLFEALRKKKDYPLIEVTSLPAADAVDDVLGIASLEKLEILLKRPNADDGDADEERFLRRLEKQNASRSVTTLVAVKGQSIAPDDDTRDLANAASRNGNVIGTGHNEHGRPVVESTVERPLILPEIVNENVEPLLDVLRRVGT